MSLPPNVIALISEYSKPLTRPNWREGSNCCYSFKYDIVLTNLHQNFLSEVLGSAYFCEKYEFVRRHSSFSQDLQKYGEDIYEVSPYRTELGTNNFYFIMKKWKVLKYTGMFQINNLIDWISVMTVKGLVVKQIGVTIIQHHTEFKER